MEHTWRANHLPRLASVGNGSGDVVLCGAQSQGAAITRPLDLERVAFSAPLDARSDLEWLLRGLSLHPEIRHLVLHGDDPTLTGASLLALWQDGLDEQGRLPGSRGVLSPEFDRETLDRFRTHVAVQDLRHTAEVGLASGIRALPSRTRALPSHPKNESAEALPNPTIPERKVFFSRKTSFPIFTSDVGDGWLQLLNLSLRIGTEKQTADGQRIAEALNALVTIEAPVLEDGEQGRDPAAFPAFFDFAQEDFDHEFFPRYAKRLEDDEGENPFDCICDRLKRWQDTRSATLVGLESGALADPDTAARLISATFNASEGKLYGSFVLRSVDVYTEWPLEALALVRLQTEAAGRLGLDMGSSTFLIHSAHLYERDFARTQRVLDNFFKRPLPLHVDPSGVFLFGNDGGQARAMLLNHDASAIQWEAAFSDPEDLSWYIVDVMPWLLPQHIRYVGQECASLMRAIREKECYLQG